MKKIKIKKKAKKRGNPPKYNGVVGEFRKRFNKGSIMEKVLIVIMLILVFIFIIGFVFMIYIIISAPDFDVDNLYTKESSIIYDSEGNEIARLGTENRERVTYDDLPEVFVDALVASEDSRFFQHNGVDMARFIKATIGQLAGNSGAGGASADSDVDEYFADAGKFIIGKDKASIGMLQRVYKIGFNRDCFSYHAFQVIRTFILFTIGLSMFRCYNGLGQVKEVWKAAFAINNPWIFFDDSLNIETK